MRSHIFLCALAALIPVASLAQTDFSYCTLPGELVNDDAKGDAGVVFGAPVPDVPTPVPGLDVLAVHVAEPASDDAKERIYFTMQVDRQAAAATPQTRYMIEFTTPDKVARYLAYTPYPIAPVGMVLAGEDQMFVVGHYMETGFGLGSFNDGPADAASSATPDGLITLVAESKKLGKLKPGDILPDIIATSRFYTVTGTLVDDSSAPGVYQVRGNDSCKGKKNAEEKSAGIEDKSGASFGGAFAPSLLFGFAALRRRRSR